MDAFNLLKVACLKKNKESKLLKWDQFPTGVYKVDYFKMIETANFGLKLQVHFELKEQKHHVVLPDRFVEKLTQDAQVQELNKRKYNMVYDGKDKSHYNFIQVDFFLRDEGKQ